MTRRDVLASLAAIGCGTVTFQKALAAEVLRDEAKPTEPTTGPKSVTAEMVQQAEWIAGILLTDDDRKLVAQSLSSKLGSLRSVREKPLPNGLLPALRFDATGHAVERKNAPVEVKAPKFPALDKPKTDEDLAFAGVAKLGALLRNRKITSVELTKLTLARLKKYDPALLCVVTLLEESALKQAAAVDDELKAGKDRGPLHGIPWGAKDLIAYPGAPTTWGAEIFKKQAFEEKATVARKLDEAGAVLVAKLTLGALALGDVWFGGTTRNPWNPMQGSSGSSAGSCSAVAAGLVPFAIGSETLGSIVSPSTRCGTTGLRPTFGRVARTGCMVLCASMDKLGPITRSAEDAALVLDAILGSDPGDPSAVTRKAYPFGWPCDAKFADLTIGYVEARTPAKERAELKVFETLGCKLKPIPLPNGLANRIVGTILDVESASTFDELPRTGIRDGYGDYWRASFQAGQFVSAVEYLRANRLRTRLMQDMAKVFETVDAYVGGNDLAITNLTGHPTICLPNGFVEQGDVTVPTALTITGRLFDESTLLHLGHAYQQATGFHEKRPELGALPPAKP